MPSDPAVPSPIDPSGRLAERLQQLERRVAGLESREGIPVVTALPPAGRAGRLVMFSGTVYADTGSAWIAL